MRTLKQHHQIQAALQASGFHFVEEDASIIDFLHTADYDWLPDISPNCRKSICLCRDDDSCQLNLDEVELDAFRSTCFDASEELPEELPENLPEDLSEDLSKKLANVLQGLLDSGVSPNAIREWLDSHICLSTLTITRHYKIILNDFDKMEIVMGPLPKTLFLLYLRHPEGIDFFHLQDFKKELMDIYGHLTACDDLAVIDDRISRLIDPLENGINEKCSVIKRAFCSQLDLMVAKYYYITGMQGQAKRIALDRSLVIWE